MAKWFGRRQPPKLSIFCPFVDCKYPKPFGLGILDVFYAQKFTLKAKLVRKNECVDACLGQGFSISPGIFRG